MLLNFEDEVDIQNRNQVVDIRPKNLVNPTFNVASGQNYLNVSPDQWGWQDLRDYVVNQIETIHGPFPRLDPVKEASVFKSFLSRWSDKAGLIAKCAFEVHHGWWANAPISVKRFMKSSDSFFASIIASSLNTVES